VRLFLGPRPFVMVQIGADGLARLDNGRQVFAKAMKTLLLRNDLSHAELKVLSEWANPSTPGWLSTSQISYLRTGRLKAIGPRTIDALGQLNLHLAKLAGDDSPDVRELPKPPPLPNSLKGRLERPFFLRHPETGLALNAGDLSMIWLGRLDPKDLADDGVSSREARRISEALSIWLQKWCMREGVLLTQGMPQILDAYGVKEKARKDALRSVATGMRVFEPEELLSEREALARMLQTLNGGTPPADARELSLLVGAGG
jgi:hypothetical protein